MPHIRITQYISLLLIALSWSAGCTGLNRSTDSKPEPPSSRCAEDPDLTRIFEERGVEGTMIIASLDGSRVFTHNAPRASRRFLPASTFKIPNTLIALEERAVVDKMETVPWDGVDRGWDVWNRDQNLESAFPVSCVWFYQELAKRIGHEPYLDYFQRMDYGNKKTGDDVSTFWLEGDLRISADEQIEFLRKLCNRDLPFETVHFDTLKSVMLVDETEQYRLHAKTGWAIRVEPHIGWYVGYVERGDEVWLFAMNMEIPFDEAARFRKEISRAALKAKGIL